MKFGTVIAVKYLRDPGERPRSSMTMYATVNVHIWVVTNEAKMVTYSSLVYNDS